MSVSKSDMRDAMLGTASGVPAQFAGDAGGGEPVAFVSVPIEQYRAWQSDRGDGEDLFAEYFTPDEAARQVGVCRRTLDRWHRYREGPPRTVVGRKVLYRKESLREWVRAHEQSTN